MAQETQHMAYRERLLLKQKEYYERNKEAKTEYARNRYRNITKEQRDKLVLIS